MNALGFALVKEAFIAEEVTYARTVAERCFDLEESSGSRDGHVLFLNAFERAPLESIADRFSKIVQAVVGDYFYVHSSIQKNKWSPWHKDTDGQEVAGHRFHYDEGFSMVQCAWYLQGNSLDKGGGLDILPGTHRDVSSPFVAFHLEHGGRPHTGLDLEVSSKKYGFVESTERDAVVFETKLSHRGSFGPGAQLVPKFLVIALFSKTLEHREQYLEFYKTLSQGDYL